MEQINGWTTGPMQITLSSHVLDLDQGGPAAELGLTLCRTDGSVVYEGTTDDDGRIEKQTLSMSRGEVLVLRFATGAWYERRGAVCFYPYVEVAFTPQEGGHYHVPLLINRHGYSTYRGS